MGGKSANKAGYFDKLKGLLEEYQSVFIVTVDNVSSQQMHEIRIALRGQAIILMGKNTMVRHKKWQKKKTFPPQSGRALSPSRS
jgi:large subunit ribosomal protein LP0